MTSLRLVVSNSEYVKSAPKGKLRLVASHGIILDKNELTKQAKPIKTAKVEKKVVKTRVQKKKAI
jgi:hypothetical protein